MKKGSDGKTTLPKSNRSKIFGATSLQLSEQDALCLVGGVLEKGFSQEPQKKTTPPLSAPLPTVLPFPVARHRSHGPHWTLKSSDVEINSGGDDDNDGDDEENRGSMEIEQFVGFAKPVKRKGKKGMDFSRWRELINNDSSSLHSNLTEKASRKSQKRSQVSEKSEDLDRINRNIDADVGIGLRKEDLHVDIASDAPLEVAYMAIDGAASNLQNDRFSIEDEKHAIWVKNSSADAQDVIMEDSEHGLLESKAMQVDIKMQGPPISPVTPSSHFDNFGDEQRTTSLESQIDAENHALLQRMSADEIAEAQSEIMEKISPALIKVLQRRGEQKLKKSKCLNLNVNNNHEVGTMQTEKSFTTAKIENDISHQVTTTSLEDTGSVLDNNAVKKSSSVGSSLWDGWSYRVEAVRELRFSLDGNVVQPKTGGISTDSGYSADNVSQRDFLRTEGDPGAAGYTIKEAVALTRSVVPGQRALALHLLASVLDKTLCNICQNQVWGTLCCKPDGSIDWEAVWAFVLGPEPELALSLRMTLDDNHDSVVLACAKVIQCVLSCDINESFFNVSEKIPSSQMDVFTAPIFRSRPEIDGGFLRGGYWKYNTKPSNILHFDVGAVNDKPEGDHTIQDDLVVSGQDFAAGLVRMGLLPRLRYLLETNPSVALEESIISILIAIARHSPTCCDAMMKCQHLIQTVIDRFVMKDQMDVTPSKVKSITLLKVLAQSGKKNCRHFKVNGIFQKVTWHLYRYMGSLDPWLKLGREKSKLWSALLVEQLRFWKACIQYGYCVSYFSDLFPALCTWLDVPNFENLTGKNIVNVFAAVAMEAYLVVEALTRRLPNLYSQEKVEVTAEDLEIWNWSQVVPIVDIALRWIDFKTNSLLFKILGWLEGNGSSPMQHLTLSSIVWVISAVIHMLSGVLKGVIPSDTMSLHSRQLPWLPEFVPRIGLGVIKSEFLSFPGLNVGECVKDLARSGSFLKYLCDLRQQTDHETSVASVCCLRGLVQLTNSVDKLIKLAYSTPSCQGINCSREGEILSVGVLESSLIEFETVLTTFMKLMDTEWQNVQSIEVFGRGGPAPGVCVGWGASGGGFWSTRILLTQMDAGLLIELLQIFQIAKDLPAVEEISSDLHRINAALEVSLVLGPRDALVFEKTLDILLQVPTLKYLNLCIRHFLHLKEGLKVFAWAYSEEEYLLFSNILASHFKKRWLSVKKKIKAVDNTRDFSCEPFKTGHVSLEIIHEDEDPSTTTDQDCCSTNSMVEWANQRLPLPMNWFLSPIATISYSKPSDCSGGCNVLDYVVHSDFLDVVKGGLFFLLGLEAMSNFLSSEFQATVCCVPLIWKLHALSVNLIVGMDVLEDEKSRDVYETLQDMYGRLLDQSEFPEIRENFVENLKFQTEIHESYSTFIETLVEQFAAISYGDLICGRQVAIYLHRSVEAPVRLAAWNALSNACVLELLPPAEKCIAKIEGYLEPVEENEKILEAYVKSWVCGALDKAATRGSVAFMLVLHHISSFIFSNLSADKLSLRNKLVKSLLRDYSRTPKHEGMIPYLIRYSTHARREKPGQEEVSLQGFEVEKRLEILREACDGNSSLLGEVNKLESSLLNDIKL